MPNFVSNTQKTINVDLNARERFEREIARGYAGISFIDSKIKTVKCISTHNLEFRNGDRGARDAQRAKVHFEASQLPRGEQRVLSWYLDIGIQGKFGTVAPHEIKAEAVRRTTGGPCAPSTHARHEASLCRRGWLSKSLVPTGTRVLEDDGTWTTRKVLKVTLTLAARLLYQKTYIHTPTPKRRTTERVNNRERVVSTISLSVVCDESSKMERREPVVMGLSKELPKGNKLTRPSPPSSAQTVKQRASRGASRKAANKAAAVSPPVSARKSRAGIPKTWRTAVRTLLAELFPYFHDDPNCSEILRVAKLQTDPHYPAAWPTALDWDPIVIRWVQMGWHDRRRCIKNEIAPPLRAWCALLSPPDVPTTEQEKQHAELAAWLQVIPYKIPASVPDMVAERMKTRGYWLNALVRRIHAGKADLSDLSGDDHTLLHQAGHILGEF